jgi:two-component system, OmpR family, sensor histidine kinase MprB
VSFRTRIALAGAAAVAVAVAAASAITYVVVRGELRSEIDEALRTRAATTRLRIVEDPGSGRRFLDLPPAFLGGASGYLQLVTSDGRAIRPIGESVALPITDRDRAAASGEIGEAFFSDADVRGTHVRVLTLPLEQGYALQISRPLDEVDSALARIRNWLLVVAVVGMGIAAALGLVVARAALAPVRRLTRTAEEVTETRDLSRRIEERGRDELARLATSFNTMLAALEASARSQRQLVSDASHELRTPLTSLRTNIEVLARDETLPLGERESLLRDVTEQLEEMTVLVAELVELARGDKGPVEPEDVRLDLVTADAIERTKRNHPGITVTADLEETPIYGVRATIERAVSNLLDNAAKWSPPEGEIEVTLRARELTVRDHGPGIAEEDLPFVFDRFYRAPSARSMPGSGLGLAIVRQVAEAHGGSASVETPDGGGTRLRLVLPSRAAVSTP